MKRAILAIVDPVAGAQAALAAGLRFDVLEPIEPTRTYCHTALVEIVGDDDAVRRVLYDWGVEPDDVPDFLHGTDGYGDPYPYPIPDVLLNDPMLNNATDLESGPSFNCMSPGEDGLSDTDTAHRLWVGHPDPARRDRQGLRFRLESQGDDTFETDDVDVALAELKRRWQQTVATETAKRDAALTVIRAESLALFGPVATIDNHDAIEAHYTRRLRELMR